MKGFCRSHYVTALKVRQKITKTLLPVILKSSSWCTMEQIRCDAVTEVGSITILREAVWKRLSFRSRSVHALMSLHFHCNGFTFPPEACKSFMRWEGFTPWYGDWGIERPSRSRERAKPRLGPASAHCISVLTSLDPTGKLRGKLLIFRLGWPKHTLSVV